MKVVSVWADSVPRRIGGWLSIPDDAFGGFSFGAAQACGTAEQTNHCLRQTVWQRALKSGVWLPGTLYRGWADVDSRSKRFTEAGGSGKGYNPVKRGANAYHPLVAFAVTPGKFYRPGCEAGVLTQAMVLLSLCDSWQQKCRHVCV